MLCNNANEVQPFLQKQLHLVEKNTLQRVFAPFWRKNGRFQKKTHPIKPFLSCGFTRKTSCTFFMNILGCTRLHPECGTDNLGASLATAQWQ